MPPEAVAVKLPLLLPHVGFVKLIPITIAVGCVIVTLPVAVQPPLDFLENNFTIRIHLDNTDENNGALKVIPKSHLKGEYRAEKINWETETESICRTLKGGIMIMRPLLMHSSSRTTNNAKRRVVHIEFSDKELNNGLNWSERINFN